MNAGGLGNYGKVFEIQGWGKETVVRIILYVLCVCVCVRA